MAFMQMAGPAVRARALAAALAFAATGASACDCGSPAPSDGAPPGTDAAPPPPDFDPDDYPEAALTFPFGVSSGDVDAGSAVLWTRYLGTSPLRVYVLERAGPGTGPPYVALPYDAAAPAPNDTGIVKLIADGLTPGAWHDFVFLEEPAPGSFAGRSRVGRFRAAPAPGTLEPITFAVSGDAKEDFQPYEILSAIAAENAAFFVFNGDVVYADGAVTRDEYRAFYETNWSDPSMQELMAAMPFYTIWDDHEVANNWDADTIDPAQVADARAAFLEYDPVREDPAAPARLWRRYRWGDTLELFILDCRGERAPSQGLYISPEQMAWLQEGLLGSTALYKLVVNSVPITDLSFIGADDRWDGYPAQRSEILDFIATNAIPHVFWLSADIHISLIGRLDEYGGYDLVSGPVGQTLVLFAASFLTALPSVEYASAEVFNYHLVTIDPTAAPPTLTLSMRDAAGNEFFTRTFTE